MKKLFTLSGWLAVIVGVVLIVGGIWGICFTYNNVVQENIVTPADASIPEAKVRGPFTLKAQADIIRDHMLRMSGGKTYAEMPRLIPKLDESGKEVLGIDGKPVMIANEARATWITAIALMTALHLAIVIYVLSGLIVLFGCMSMWIGIIFLALRKREAL